MTLILDQIPAELRSLDQWVLWRSETRPGSDKPTKIPYTVAGELASSTDRATWTTFGQVIEAEGYDGIGCVFAPENGMVGIDLDDSVEDGVLKPWANAIVNRFATYTEISPSGTGVKLWCRGTYPGDNTGGRRKYRDGYIEMYWRARYFAVTGRRLESCPPTIEARQDEIDGLYDLAFRPPAPRPPATPPAATIHSDAVQRCLGRCPDARSGDRGHDATLRAACECFRFGLTENEAHQVMQWWNSTKSFPQWTQKELAHKLDAAQVKVSADGEMGIRNRQVLQPVAPIAPPPAESTALHDQLENIIAGKVTNQPWPYSPMLTQLGRFLIPGMSTVICGSGGSTKSMWLNEQCLGWLETGVPFAVFHLEQDRVFHEHRALAQLANNADLTIHEWIAANAIATRDAYEQHAVTLDAFGQSVWDAPGSHVTLDDVAAWVRDRAKEGRRIIAVDPVTAADSGAEPWRADAKFVLDTKRIARDYGASIVFVTHPKSVKGGNNIDNMAGGMAYNRFTQGVLWMNAQDDETVTVKFRTTMGPKSEMVTINRKLHISKTTNGIGRGLDIGCYFDARTLRFHEHGVVTEDK
jgi:hypothetical protein